MDQNRGLNTMTEDTGVDLQDLLQVCLLKWKWILLSVVVALSVALVYVLVTVPSYKRTTSVLIKQDQKGNTIGGSVAQNLSEYGFLQGNSNITNEIITFRSPDIIHVVIERLQLNDQYTMRKLFRDEVLYGSTLPVVIDFVDLKDRSAASLTLELEEHGRSVVMTDFMQPDIELESSDEVKTFVGDTVSTPLGRICVKANESYVAGEETSSPILIKVAHQDRFAAIEAFGQKLEVALQDKQGTVIDLTLTEQNIERAVDALHTMVAVYNEFWMKDKNEITFSTTEFINERLKVLEEDLSLVDSDIATYKSSQRIPDIAANAHIDLGMAAQAESKLQELNNQLSVARFLLSYIKGSTDKLLPGNVGLTDNSIQSQVTEYNRLCLQRGRLVENSSEENLLVKDIDAQMSALRSAIINSVANYISSVDLQLKTVQGNRDKINSRISSNPKQAGHLLSAERQQKVKEGLYLFLLQKKEENEISQTFVPYNTRTIMEPEYGGNNKPIAPQKKKILGIAFLLGLILPVGVIYLMMSMNTRVRGRKDLENLSTPLAGELPFVGDKRRDLFGKLFVSKNKNEDDPVSLYVKPKSRDAINEAFRVVRTNIDFMLSEHQHPVIMVTSANVNSGKTFVSSNMAITFGLKNAKVVVVDLDLRKRSLSKTFGCTGNKGVVDYLTGKSNDVASLIEKKEVDVLPVGVMPPNPAELLVGARLGSLLDELRKSYDYIFVDCPPVEIVTDADIVGKWADMTLFVVRANLLEKAVLPDIERYYQEKRFNHLSLILNGTDATGRYGYKYGYRNGSYYGGY